MLPLSRSLFRLSCSCCLGNTKLLPLRYRIFCSRRYEVELRIHACSLIRAIDEGHTACIVFTEVDRLDDLCSAAFDLRRGTVVDDVTLRIRVVVQLRIEVVDT